MPANTGNGWPYVLSTDNVADYPVTSLALANKLEATVPFAICVGSTSLSVGSAASYTKAVGFPAGFFSQTPMIVLTKSASGVAGAKWVPRVLSPTTAGFTVGLDTGDGSTGGSVITATVYFVAVQWSATSGATPGVTLAAQEVDLTAEADPAAMRALLAEIEAAGGVLLG